MHNENTALSLRRSSRVPVVLPILVSSLDGAHFSEVCETLVVNAHGCAIRSRARLDPGVALHLHSKDGRGATARVVSCQPMGSDGQSWRLGAKLDQPHNFWGLQTFPEDWTVSLTSPLLPKISPLASPTRSSVQVFSVQSECSEANAQFSKEQVKKIVLELVRPLHAEITLVKEKLARAEVNRSRFDVSLSSIPPELEQQLEQRLRQELGPKVIEEARQQSARLLMATKEAIAQMVGEVQEEFRRKSKEEVEVVERRAGQIATHIVESVREQLREGVGDMQRKLADGRNQLNRLSSELMESLQAKLKEEHSSRRQEVEQLKATVAAESSRLYEQIKRLDDGVRKLEDAVHSLESGFEQRLSQMAHDTVRNTRNEIEGVADSMLKELTTRSVQTLGNQMEEAAGNMRIFHQGIVTSGSDALKAKAVDALRDFEHATDELARLSMERWRQRLASGLNALVTSLGEQFQLEARCGGDDKDS